MIAEQAAKKIVAIIRKIPQEDDLRRYVKHLVDGEVCPECWEDRAYKRNGARRTCECVMLKMLRSDTLRTTGGVRG